MGNDMSNRMPDSNTMALPPAAASISAQSRARVVYLHARVVYLHARVVAHS